jgi:hypothetical protein
VGDDLMEMMIGEKYKITLNSLNVILKRIKKVM